MQWRGFVLNFKCINFHTQCSPYEINLSPVWTFWFWLWFLKDWVNYLYICNDCYVRRIQVWARNRKLLRFGRKIENSSPILAQCPRVRKDDTNLEEIVTPIWKTYECPTYVTVHEDNELEIQCCSNKMINLASMKDNLSCFSIFF